MLLLYIIINIKKSTIIIKIKNLLFLKKIIYKKKKEIKFTFIFERVKVLAVKHSTRS